jgi:hypothetical protein
VSRGNIYPFMPFHGHSNTLVGRRGEQGVCSTIYFYSSTSPRIGATNGTRNFSFAHLGVPVRSRCSSSCEWFNVFLFSPIPEIRGKAGGAILLTSPPLDVMTSSVPAPGEASAVSTASWISLIDLNWSHLRRNSLHPMSIGS